MVRIAAMVLLVLLGLTACGGGAPAPTATDPPHSRSSWPDARAAQDGRSENFICLIGPSIMSPGNECTVNQIKVRR